MENDNAKSWYVYLIECSDGRLYTGITNDLEKRWRAHAEGKGGAKFFRGRRPLRFAYLETARDRSAASVREAQIKKLSRAEKLALIEKRPANAQPQSC